MAAIALPLAIGAGLAGSGLVQGLMKYLLGGQQIEAQKTMGGRRAEASALLSDKLATQKAQTFEKLKEMAEQQKQQQTSQMLSALSLQSAFQQNRAPAQAMQRWAAAQQTARTPGAGFLDIMRSVM